MRAIGWIIAVLVLLAGCTQVDENPKFNPQAELPSWAYDAPFYYQPPQDLPALETVGEGVGVYYTRDESFFVRHPGGCQLNGVPRVGVYYSLDMGQTWTKAGYFGVEQTHFNFLAKEEGRYWVRFVGPGQGVADCPPGAPHRVYVVDRKSPAIVLSVLPSPWEDERRGVPRLYEVGQNVRLSWGVSDTHLDPSSIRMGICFAAFPHNVVWSSLPEALAEADSITVELPPEAARHGGIRFRLEARDKCGNIGLAMTEVLQVGAGEGKPSTAPSSQPSVTLELPPAAATQPASGPAEPLKAAEERPGWPKVTERLQGGSPQELRWLPEGAGNYTKLELQFSSNDGLMWQTVATGLKPGQAVAWTVPHVTSKSCRLRIVGVAQPTDGDKVEVTLAMTQQFVVNSGVTTAPAAR
ncbi:MAG: hypothetical protein MUP47_04740 [Phycisphaerae bacterium]|nr:hypothetical protein [Phycisphaerae bacterium]